MERLTCSTVIRFVKTRSVDFDCGNGVSSSSGCEMSGKALMVVAERQDYADDGVFAKRRVRDLARSVGDGCCCCWSDDAKDRSPDGRGRHRGKLLTKRRRSWA